MPHYTATIEIARPLAEVFAFFSSPRNLAMLAPPELNLELLSAPAILECGATLVWKGRRWGISQRIVQRVTAYDIEKQIVMEQTEGPLRRWIHAHQFGAFPAGTQLLETIDFEPPTGLLGRLVTADAILKDLSRLYEYRKTRLEETFASRPVSRVLSEG
jgi:ligand-binding SRPBCC domain-containing protein